MRKKIILVASVCLMASATASAQSAIDAYNMSSNQLRGSARFVGMGGAFTSLGGDISSMTQNPAGLGLYRHSEVGTGFDISIRSYKAETDQGSYSNNHTKAYYDNFGYVGTARLKGALRTFNWGVSYNRIATFDRRFNGYNRPTESSMTNYIAAFTDGTNSTDMLFDKSKDYNPYLDSDADWLSILAYNSLMINNTGNATSYAGLFQNGTEGDAEYSIRERGHTDEYNIDFAGNVSDIVFWGLGVGIVDMSYSRESNYSESMAGALVYANNGDNLATGNAGFGLYNNKYVSGTGANLKFGVIVRPFEMLRIGLAVHTPSWMHLTSSGYGETEYNYTVNGSSRTNSGREYTDDFEYNWRLNTPWKFMVGASLVIGNKAIVSLDYEHAAYGSMKVGYQSWNGWDSGYTSDEKVNTDIKNYFKASNTIRLGVEYRLSRQFSLRAGYNYQTTNVRDAAANGHTEIFTSGTDTGYTFDKDTQNICFGIGYRYQAWYIDLTYQHTRKGATFHAYTPYQGVTETPSADLTLTNNNIIISSGFKF